MTFDIDALEQVSPPALHHARRGDAPSHPITSTASARTWELAGGSVTGRHHALAGRNNQDAYAWGFCERGFVAVVCDGCGSGAASEVGARLGARLAVASALRRLGSGIALAPLLEEVRLEVLEHLGALADAMSEGTAAARARTVAEHFLFTVAGVIADAETLQPFITGDGLILVDDRRYEAGPFPNNEPPYWGYALCDRDGNAERSRLQFLPAAPAREVTSVLLGTDGACALDPQFLESLRADDRVFRNPDMVRRRLAVRGRTPPGLSDDTTLLVLRRTRALTREPAPSDLPPSR